MIKANWYKTAYKSSVLKGIKGLLYIIYITCFMIAPDWVHQAVAQTAVVESDNSPNNPSGLSLPRMVTVKAEGVNVRLGPGVNFGVKWVLSRKDLPVEIIAEYESWRKVRDWEGGEGWVFHAALSSSRTLIIIKNDVVLRALASDNSPAVARLNVGISGKIKSCDVTWCAIDVQGYEGWVQRDQTWGLYTGEIIK